MSQKGVVAWSYESTIAPSSDNTGQMPVTIVVQDILSEAPSISGQKVAGAFGLLPVLSLANLVFPIHAVNLNDADGAFWKEGGIRRWEIAEILEQELRKSGIVNKVVLARGNNAGDYEIRGSVNFMEDRYVHLSGLGELAYAFLILPMFTLPSTHDNMRCDAHFEVVSRKNMTSILSKDYHSEISFSMRLIDLDKRWSEYGKKVFPQIVKRFIADLKALPKSAWSQ